MVTRAPSVVSNVVSLVCLNLVSSQGLVLADLGATVVRVDNPVSVDKPPNDLLCRGKQSIAISPKTPAGLATLRRLVSASHVLIDPFR